jgi:hypothetical protein
VLFLEPLARPLLILHAILAAILVASSTHHLLWSRPYLRSDFSRAPSERRFALIAACAFLSTFALGNLLYPTYKVRVRAEYLDSPTATAAHASARAADAERLGHPPPTPRTSDLSRIARLFDIKEHFMALGCAAALALLFLSRRAHPARDRRTLPLYFGLSLTVCAAA